MFRVTRSLSTVFTGTRNTTSAKQAKAILTEVQSAAEEWAKKRLQQNRDIVHAASAQNSTQEKMLRRASIGSGQKREIVTASMKRGLEEIHASLATLPKGIPPLQERGKCEFQAKNIVQGAYESSRAQHANGAGSTEGEKVDEKSGGFWKSLMKAITSDPAIKAVAMINADQLLDIYNNNGPFVLRGPKLDDPRQESEYMDHAIAIMAAVKVRIDGQGEKIVFCAIDCNDAGKDDETVAAQQQAAKLGKNPSALTHAEADSFGVDRRRIRLINADSVVHRLWNHTWDMKVQGLDMESEAFFMTRGAPLLTNEQTEQLKDLIGNNWSEVEDYTDADYSGLAHKKLLKT